MQKVKVKGRSVHQCFQQVLRKNGARQWDCEITADEAADDRHAVGGQCSGLVGADCRRVAHRLARVQVPHQVVVFHHPLSTANNTPVRLLLPACHVVVIAQPNINKRQLSAPVVDNTRRRQGTWLSAFSID